METANDNSKYGRRPAAYTLSGSNDGSAWTVIYNGTYADIEDADWTYFYVDFANTAAYQFYKFECEESWEGPDDGGEIEYQDILQFCRFIICTDIAVAEVPTEAPTEEAPPPAPAEVAPPAAPPPAATDNAPKTGDAAVLLGLISMLGAGGLSIFRSQKGRHTRGENFCR
jgi:hypothetical protein